jgi:Rrf2 family nitric oxide-sensitive transcriptional repressor
MRLTTYTDYSLRLLIYVAACGEQSVTIAAVAESYGISRHHLVKVAHQLGVKGFLVTVRGKNGGIRLARPASAIVVADVVRAMEPDMAIAPCLHPDGGNCRIVPVCSLRGALKDARSAFLSVLEELTVADLSRSQKKLQALLQIQ